MPTRNVSLTPEQGAFIDRMIAAGEYHDAGEAIRDALRALQQRRLAESIRPEAIDKDAAEDPFALFEEWSSPADEKAYAGL